MSSEFDVAVVGGGPSGAAVAHFLAHRGHSVVVCEKKTFPREKTCGDGLTPRAVKVLKDMGLGDELDTWEKVRGLRVHAAGRTLELDFPELSTTGTTSASSNRAKISTRSCSTTPRPWAQRSFTELR